MCVCGGGRVEGGLRFDPDTLLAQSLLVKHVIRLIQHKHLDPINRELLPAHQIQHGPGGADDDLSVDFLPFGDHVRDCELRLDRCELAHSLHDRHDLSGELTGRGKTERLHFVDGHVDAREHGEDEGGGFASAGLGLADHVCRRVLEEEG